MFFEDSLRTRVGFDVAAARLGARSVTATGQAALRDDVGRPSVPRTLCAASASWCDVLCLRHPEVDTSLGAAARATPVINCGNGTDEHPIQALVDAFALHELLGAHRRAPGRARRRSRRDARGALARARARGASTMCTCAASRPRACRCRGSLCAARGCRPRRDAHDGHGRRRTSTWCTWRGCPPRRAPAS